MMSAIHLAYGPIFMTCILAVVFSSVENKKPDGVRQPCSSMLTCASCIGLDVQCSWCNDKISSKRRCVWDDNHDCDENAIVNPSHEIDFVQNEPLSDEQGKKILIKPQKIRLQIRPHEKATIPLEFYTTQDHAVDMYFLMDLSATMINYIADLSAVSMDLVGNIRNLTGSLQVGIGSFVDKMTLPYGVCESPGGKCRDSFAQISKLSHDFNQFKQKVSGLKDMTINNLDTPEGGLDALMQAVVCGNKIGWRNNSRKLIIYCSDAPFHFAGDGQLGGIVIPNDGECYMEKNKYTMDYTQDYPSVQHIAKTVQEHAVTVIFAVAGKKQQPLYHLLRQELVSSYVSMLDNKASTIANIVTKAYKDIKSTVEMKADSQNFKVDFLTNCRGKWEKSNNCSTELGKVVYFQAVITAPECPKGNQSKTQTIKIHPISSDAQLEIEVELICKCSCKEKEHNSSTCNNNGMLYCGECTCNPGFSGELCGCDHSLNEIDIKTCVKENDTRVCSGRGSCECGKCVCETKASNKNLFYRGAYCECDDYSCPNVKLSLCGGASQGECKCGVCKCKKEYEGNDCNCPVRKDTCMSKNNKICNGHGQCKCGVCICNANSVLNGPTCENCQTCNNWCDDNKECVTCWMSKGGNRAGCAPRCEVDNVHVVDNLTANNTEDIVEVCEVDIDDCTIKYQTIIQNGMGEKEVHILKTPACPESNTLGMIIGIVSGILLLGVLLLVVWKIATTFLDRRELARFNEEKANATWTAQNNPLFVQSSTTYQNPTWVLNG